RTAHNDKKFLNLANQKRCSAFNACVYGNPFRDIAHHFTHQLPLDLPCDMSQTLAGHLPHHLAWHLLLDLSHRLRQRWPTV
uniref:Uncharacterized protein n=1 Tax=Romanomermis culicivorax TaxID=13658 RepID=A0A915I4M3_ROMCU